MEVALFDQAFSCRQKLKGKYYHVTYLLPGFPDWNETLFSGSDYTTSLELSIDYKTETRGERRE